MRKYIGTDDFLKYGLIGSTEWVEDFQPWISKHVVAYLNLGELYDHNVGHGLNWSVDVSVAGSMWAAGASPLLSHAIYQAALDVPHPTKPGLTLWDARDDRGPFEGDMDYEFSVAYNASQTRSSKAYDTGIFPLGSGSDFTAFLQRLGVPSCDQSFAPTPYDAPYHYHSIYDSQHWQETFADPGFHRHVRHYSKITVREILM